MVRNLLAMAWFLVKMATPLILKLCWAAVSFTLMSLAAFWSGIPTAANQIADYWLEEAIKAGWSTLYDRQLRAVLLVLAYAGLVGGWLLSAFMTVFIVRIIF
jgi:hypothetical protein